MTRRRWLMAGTVAIVTIECLIWYIGAEILWSTRNLIVGAGSVEAVKHAQFARAVLAGTVANAIALVVFMLGSRRWGWWVLLGVQLCDLLVTVVAALRVEQTWWLLSFLAVLTLCLLLLLRRQA
jgi:hypothetical protein